MNLLRDTRQVAQWLDQVVGRFLRIRPLVTLTVICATVGSRIANFLAFVLPLKVILLVGSEGVPRYFQFFMAPEDKTFWMIVLSGAAVGLYLLSMALDVIADRSARIGGAWVLRQASEMALLNNQENVVGNHFARVCAAYGALLFIAVAMAAGLALNFWLFLFILGLLAVEYLLTALLLIRHEPGDIRGVGAYVEGQLRQYVNLLSSVNFLAAFGVLLAGFLWYGLDNIIIAIASILLIRQLLSNVTSLVTDVARLARDRATINALVFPQHQLHAPEKSVFQRFRRLFAPERREARMQQVRASSGVDDGDQLSLRWVDTKVNATAAFEWTVTDASGAEKALWLERVFFPSQRAALEHETFLFRHLAADTLRAARHLFRYREEDFECQFYDYGSGEQVAQKAWSQFFPDALAYYLGLRPPQALQEAYFGSKPIIDARVDEDFIARLDVAVDTERDRRCLEALTAALPAIRRRVGELPLSIHNPQIGPDQTVIAEDGVARFLSWGRWVLEPVGFALKPVHLKDELLPKMVAAVQGRKDCPSDFSGNDLRLVSALARFEESVNKQWYNAALQLGAELVDLAGPLVESADAARAAR